MCIATTCRDATSMTEQGTHKCTHRALTTARSSADSPLESTTSTSGSATASAPAPAPAPADDVRETPLPEELCLAGAPPPSDCVRDGGRDGFGLPDGVREGVPVAPPASSVAEGMATQLSRCWLSFDHVGTATRACVRCARSRSLRSTLPQSNLLLGERSLSCDSCRQCEIADVPTRSYSNIATQRRIPRSITHNCNRNTCGALVRNVGVPRTHMFENVAVKSQLKCFT